MTDRLCPWCSAALPAKADERCPACGASLVEPGEDLPGLTSVDPAALRPGRVVAAKPRGILGFLSGEYEEAEATAPEGALAPPPDDVRREMLRMAPAAAEAEMGGRGGRGPRKSGPKPRPTRTHPPRSRETDRTGRRSPPRRAFAVRFAGARAT